MAKDDDAASIEELLRQFSTPIKQLASLFQAFNRVVDRSPSGQQQGERGVASSNPPLSIPDRPQADSLSAPSVEALTGRTLAELGQIPIPAAAEPPKFTDFNKDKVAPPPIPDVPANPPAAAVPVPPQPQQPQVLDPRLFAPVPPPPPAALFGVPEGDRLAIIAAPDPIAIPVPVAAPVEPASPPLVPPPPPAHAAGGERGAAAPPRQEVGAAAAQIDPPPPPSPPPVDAGGAAPAPVTIPVPPPPPAVDTIDMDLMGEAVSALHDHLSSQESMMDGVLGVLRLESELSRRFAARLNQMRADSHKPWGYA